MSDSAESDRAKKAWGRSASYRNGARRLSTCIALFVQELQVQARETKKEARDRERGRDGGKKRRGLRGAG